MSSRGAPNANDNVVPEEGYCVGSEVDHLGEILAAMRSDNEDLVLESVVRVRKVLSQEVNPPIAEVYGFPGMLDCLIDLLQRQSAPKIVFESLWAISNLLSGDSETTHNVVQRGVVPLIYPLISSDEMDVAQQSMWALGNIAGDAADLRNLLLEIPEVVPLTLTAYGKWKLPANGKSVVQTLLWFASNLCRGKPHPRPELCTPLVPVFVDAIETVADEESIIDSMYGISYILDIDASHIMDMDSGSYARRIVASTVNRLRSLVDLGDGAMTLKVPCCRILGGFASGDDRAVDILLEHGVLGVYSDVLKNCKRKNLQKEIYWGISNITAGNQAQVSAVVRDEKLFGRIISECQDPATRPDVRKEIAYIISNAISGGVEANFQVLLEKGTISALTYCLHVSPQVESLRVALEGLKQLVIYGVQVNEGKDQNLLFSQLEGAGTLEILEQLQHHNNQQIYEMAMEILDLVGEDVVEDFNAAAEIPDEGALANQIAGLGLAPPVYQFGVHQTEDADAND